MEIQKNVTLNASITAKVDESETNVVNMYAEVYKAITERQE